MKIRTLRTWTKRLILGNMIVCILSTLFGGKVQAFSYVKNSHRSVEKENESWISIINIEESYEYVTNAPRQLAIKYVKEVEAYEIDNSKSVTVMLTGDLMCLAGQQYAAMTEQKTFTFDECFSYVRPIFSCADLVIGNLETLISPSNPYTYEQKMVGDSPNCNAMQGFLISLVNAGFTGVVTVNNHVLDGGEIGIQETLVNLDEMKIGHTGTFATGDEQQFLLYDVNGIRIAILSYTEIVNNRSTLPANKVNTMISCYSKQKVMDDVEAAKNQGADFIIAYNHWGTENTHEVTSRQKADAQEMADAGVDLIIGSHPHCLQPAKYITASDGRNVLCVYSMGNFVSSMTRDINSDTIILEVVLHKNKKGTFAGSIGYYPLKVMNSFQGANYVIFPVFHRNEIETKYEKKLLSAKQRIEKVIGSEISMIQSLQ